MEEFHIAFGLDVGLVPCAGILMTSIVMHHPGRSVNFHLAVTGLRREDKLRFDTFVQLYRNTRIFIYDASRILEAVPEDCLKNAADQMNRTSFLRVVLPDLLPRSVERFLYLDADMLCVGRMDELWNTELAGAVLGAVYYDAAESRQQVQRLGMAAGLRYFDAGMMLVNAALWRKRGLTVELLALYCQHAQSFAFLEQDALNVLLAGQVHAVYELPCSCNHRMNVFQSEQIKPVPEDVLLHFVHAGKPRQYSYTEQARSLWLRWKGLSLWYDLPELEPWKAESGSPAGKCAEKQDAASLYAMDTADTEWPCAVLCSENQDDGTEPG